MFTVDKVIGAIIKQVSTFISSNFILKSDCCYRCKILSQTTSLLLS